VSLFPHSIRLTERWFLNALSALAIFFNLKRERLSYYSGFFFQEKFLSIYKMWKYFKFLLLGLVLLGIASLMMFWMRFSKEKARLLAVRNDLKEVVFCQDGLCVPTETKKAFLADFLEEKKIKKEEGDYLFPRVESALYSGATVFLNRKVPVEILADGQKREVKTFGLTVADVLAEEGVVLSHLDLVLPGKEVRPFLGMKVEVVRINVEEVAEKEAIPFKTQEKEDNTLKWRTTKIGTEGQNGEKEIIYRITYTNGKESKREKIATKTTKEPVNKVILNGTKLVLAPAYKGRASWYAFNGEMSCASLKHPFGTWLKVTNRINGKSVLVEVKDSGPYSPDKIIDLDKTAFKKLGDLGQGVMDVKIEEILD
jgi:uncharacterized protein YabE (DUF348 family)